MGYGKGEVMDSTLRQFGVKHKNFFFECFQAFCKKRLLDYRARRSWGSNYIEVTVNGEDYLFRFSDHPAIDNGRAPDFDIQSKSTFNAAKKFLKGFGLLT